MLTRWMSEARTKGGPIDGPLARVCRKDGLRRIGWHVLRHTYALHLVIRGATLMEVKEFLGHTSLDNDDEVRPPLSERPHGGSRAIRLRNLNY